jgi:hypothetical protein
MARPYKDPSLSLDQMSAPERACSPKVQYGCGCSRLWFIAYIRRSLCWGTSNHDTGD